MSVIDCDRCGLAFFDYNDYEESDEGIICPDCIDEEEDEEDVNVPHYEEEKSDDEVTHYS